MNIALRICFIVYPDFNHKFKKGIITVWDDTYVDIVINKNSHGRKTADLLFVW